MSATGSAYAELLRVLRAATHHPFAQQAADVIEAQERATTVRFLGDMQKLSIAPGDVLVLRAAGRLTRDQVADMKRHLESITGIADVKVLVLDGGISIGVLEPRF